MSRTVKFVGITGLLWSVVCCSCSTEQTTMQVASTQPRKRQLADVALTAELTEGEVLQKWGPPDSIGGSGIEYRCYQLEEGETLCLNFDGSPPHRLFGAIIVKNGRTTDLFPPP